VHAVLLLDEVEDTGVHAGQHRLHPVLAGQHDHRYRGVDVVDAARDLQAVHVRHVEIAHHHLGDEGGQLVEGLLPAAGGLHLPAVVLHQLRDHLDGDEGVVHQEHAPGGPRLGRELGAGFGPGFGPGGIGIGCEMHCHARGGSPIGRT
jgi:hypothetical protein